MSIISCLITTTLISYLIVTSLSLAPRDKTRVKQRVYQRVQKRKFTESIGSESNNHMSLITCHSSHVTHLMSHHYVTDTKLLPIYSWVATFNFCQWPLPTSYRIILPVTSAHPLRSNLCQPRSVLLPRRIGIGFQGVSHWSQPRSYVTHLMCHHYVTHLISHHYFTRFMSHHYVTHLM